MISVREIRLDDGPALLDLGRAMHAESPNYRDFELDETKVEHWVKVCSTEAMFNGFVTHEGENMIGFIAGGVLPLPLTTGQYFEDIGFYVRPGRRGTIAAIMLLQSIIPWAKVMGANGMRMGITTGTNVPQAQSFLEKMGFENIGPIMLMRF